MEIYFIGVDVGSASVRSAIFDQQGNRIAFAVRPIQQFHSNVDWVAQSSSDIWDQVCSAVKETVLQAKIDKNKIVSIGFDATCSLVAIGHDGSPISVSENGSLHEDIIMWMDHRAKKETTDINLTNDPVLKYVGGEVNVEMELPKILWLKNNHPERYQATWRFFDLADYLVWKSTSADVASVCTLTCKWNYLSHKKRFDDKFLAKIGLNDVLTKIPKSVTELGGAVGTLTPKAAIELGLTEKVIVASGIIDAHAGGVALVGSDPKNSLAIISGTSNCHMIVNPKSIYVPGVWGPYYGAMLPNFWLNEGGQSAAGALLEWTIRQHSAWPEIVKESEEKQCHYYQLLNHYVNQLEQKEQRPTQNLHILADHHGNRSPRANADAKGMISGLTLETGVMGLARIYLATLQAIAYGTLHIIDTLTESGYQIDKIIMCGGATKNPLWLREYSDVTGREIVLVKEEDAVNLGAAILAAVAAKAFPNIQSAAQSMVASGITIKPNFNSQNFHKHKYRVYLQMYQDQQKYNQFMMLSD